MSKPTGRTIAIAATFTIDPLLPSLSLLLGQVGLACDIQVGPYGQLFQQLLSNSGPLATNDKGANIVLVRLQDFVRDIKDTNSARDLIKEASAELRTAIAAFLSRTKVPLVLSVLTPSQTHPLHSELISAGTELVSSFQSMPGVVLLSADDIELVSFGIREDPISDELAHVPYTTDHYAALALAVARKIHALLVPAHKVLVLDCDNTLWRGIVGEDGIEGISITPNFAKLQEFALDAYRRGALICLVSKNNERDVVEVFEKRREMILKLEHVVARRISWDPKPQGITSLARSLNLGLDSFVFLDDNPVECALMREELPQVVTLQVPDEAQIPSFVRHLWTFDKVAVTEEDLRRTQMYKENFARQEFEACSNDVSDFISSLKVEVDIAFPAEAEWPRLSQLTQRTNQFNFSTKRRTQAELLGLERRGSKVLRVNVKDRFGDYGLVGMVILDAHSDALVVDTFLLSCRVLGRGVEHTILRKVGELATDRSLALVVIPFVSTSKNEPARAFIESVAGMYRRTEEDQIVFSIPSEVAGRMTHKPGHDPVEVINAIKGGDRADPASTGREPSADRSERYTRLATVLVTGQALVAAVQKQRLRGRPLPTIAISPNSATERKMVQLWEELLAVQGLGIEDDYFALGGTSLLAASLFATIERTFGIRLPLTTILTARTIRSLCLQLDGTAQQIPGLLELKRGHARNLFLVHDGDGETLLYSNLARHLPDGTAVFGINPRSMPGIPLAHASIPDMASFYVDLIRQKQPHGPYFLGGMCAGGLIAYEIASQLARTGETINLVALLDAATPQANRRPGRLTQQRLSRLQQLFTDGESQSASIGFLLGAIARKSLNVVRWEVTSRFASLSVFLRFLLLQRILRQAGTWPKQLHGLTFRQIYERAEADYAPPTLHSAKVVLVRATQGDGGDTPYAEIFSDPTFGWRTVAKDLIAIDVAGGHFSMLQEPSVMRLAAALADHLEPSNIELQQALVPELA